MKSSNAGVKPLIAVVLMAALVAAAIFVYMIWRDAGANVALYETLPSVDVIFCPATTGGSLPAPRYLVNTKLTFANTGRRTTALDSYGISFEQTAGTSGGLAGLRWATPLVAGAVDLPAGSTAKDREIAASGTQFDLTRPAAEIGSNWRVRWTFHFTDGEEKVLAQTGTVIDGRSGALGIACLS